MLSHLGYIPAGLSLYGPHWNEMIIKKFHQCYVNQNYLFVEISRILLKWASCVLHKRSSPNKVVRFLSHLIDHGFQILNYI